MNMNYLVIDLEMCKVPKNYRSKSYRYAQEIIQVGAVLLDESFEIIGKLNQYVHPEHGVIDKFISNLTGIYAGQVKNAPRLQEVLNHMIDWIGDREYKIYAWSDSDYNQFMHEIVSKEILDTKIDDFMNTERWIDFQAVFGNRFEFSRAISLEEALLYCDIKADGRMHDGLDDAINTSKLIKLLETNDEYTICHYEKNIQMDAEPLNFSLGDLFAGLNLGYIVQKDTMEGKDMSKNEGYSRKGFFGQINHYDSSGRKIGESRPGLFGGMNHYDSNGNKTGHSHQGLFGGVNHYDDRGNRTGSSHRGFLGGVNHYDDRGRKTGHSRPGFFGDWKHFDE